MKARRRRVVVQGTLLIAGSIAVLAGATYLHVGRALLRRETSTPLTRRALAFFALWWLALAANITLVGATYIAAALGRLTFELQLVDSLLQRLLLVVSMVGLMEYLLTLLTGRSHLALVSSFYAAYGAFTLYSLLSARPAELLVTGWRTDLTYATPAPAWHALANLAAIIVPPVVAAGAYFRLFFRVDDPISRWRIALVSWAIIGWWVVAVVAGQRAALENGPLQSFQRVLSLFAALVVLAAYHPPAWVRSRAAAATA